MAAVRLFPGLVTTCALFFVAIAIGRWRIDYEADGTWIDPSSGQVYDTAGRLGYTIGALVLCVAAFITILLTVRRGSRA